MMYLIIILGVLVIMSPSIYMVASLSGNLSKSVAEFDDDTMKLYKKSSSVKRYVKIRNHKNVAIGRTAEQVHVGAVSVGGVTSGGVYKTGNDLYVAESKKSGRYELAYVKDFHGFSRDYKKIDRIILTKELFQEAKDSYISEYLDETEKCILVNDFRKVQVSNKLSYQAVMETVKISNSSGSAGLNGIGGASMKFQEKLNFAYPTKQKCLEILAWMAGEEKPVSEEEQDGDENSKE